MEAFPAGTRKVDEDMILFHMRGRVPSTMWTTLASHPTLKKCRNRIYAPDHLIEPIVEHLLFHGVTMDNNPQRVYLDNRKPWHVIVSKTYMPHVMDVFKNVQGIDVVRDEGSFTISYYQSLQPGWRWSDMHTDESLM